MNDDFSFPKTRHLRHADDFARVYARKQRAGDEHLLIFADVSLQKLTRIGLSVSEKHGHAVRRVRIKRLLREAYRLQQHEIGEGLDLILIPRVGSGAELKDYRESLVRLTRKLHKRLAQPRDVTQPLATESQR